MELIRETPNGTIWPYFLSQLRADEPQLSISLNPHDDELAAMAALDPPVLVSRVEEVAPPAVDPRIKRIERDRPVKTNGKWRQRWKVRDASPDEVAAYDKANAPKPDWARFKLALLLDPSNPNPSSTAVNTSLVTAFPITTAAVLGLSAALAKAELGDPADFALCWSAVQAAAPLPANVLSGLLSLANTCNLPSDFIAIFDPTANSNNRGGKTTTRKKS